MNLNNIKTALKIVGDQIVKTMRSNLQRNNSNATGRLSNSIESKVVQIQDDVKLEISMEDYGAAVDSGRKPSRRGGPNQNWASKIDVWASAKGISPRQGMTEKQMIFLITRKINRSGYKAKPFIQPAINSVINNSFEGVFEDALAKDIELILTSKNK
jgi:hypothetical protein